MSDVFPAPFGPRSATAPFSGTSNETPRTASETPYRTSTFSTARSGASVVPVASRACSVAELTTCTASG